MRFACVIYLFFFFFNSRILVCVRERERERFDTIDTQGRRRLYIGAR